MVTMSRVASLWVALLMSTIIVSCAAPGEKTQAAETGPRIAFITRNAATPRDYLVVSANQDETDPEELGSWLYTGRIDFHQCWSSGGKRLVFIDGARLDPTRWISVVDSDGNNRRRLTEATYIRGMSISPDGETVLLAREDRKVVEVPHDGHVDLETRYPVNIFGVSVDSGEMKRITDFNGIQAESPVFSPDGKQIAFVGRTDDPQTHFDVYVMDADGTDLRRLTHNHSFVSFQGLQWSPDSNKVLYGLETLMLSDIDHYDDVFVIDVASSKSTNLTNTPEIDDAYFTWSPDGRNIAFVSTETLRPGIWDTGVYVMDANGSNVRRIAGLEGRPSWLPDSVTLMATGRAEDGTLAIVIARVDNGERKTLFAYSSISRKYSGVSDVVWLEGE